MKLFYSMLRDLTELNDQNLMRYLLQESEHYIHLFENLSFNSREVS